MRLKSHFYDPSARNTWVDTKPVLQFFPGLKNSKFKISQVKQFVFKIGLEIGHSNLWLAVAFTAVNWRSFVATSAEMKWNVC